WARRTVVRWAVVNSVWAGALSVTVGVIAGANGPRLAQYFVMGAVFGGAVQLIGAHTLTEAPMRPVRVSLAADTGIGDSLPRSRPTFAAWSNVAMLSVALSFTIVSSMLTAVFSQESRAPLFWAALGCAMTLGFGVPITVGTAF